MDSDLIARVQRRPQIRQLAEAPAFHVPAPMCIVVAASVLPDFHPVVDFHPNVDFPLNCTR